MENVKVLLQQAILAELGTPRLPRTYDGRLKPVSGNRTYSPLPINYKGTLGNSLQVYWETDFEDGNPNLVVDFGTAEYWQYVEYGRKPGQSVVKTRLGEDGQQINYQSYTKYPPLDKIQEWARTKSGISRPFRDSKGRFMSYRSIAFLMARGIARDGINPSGFIEKAVNNVIEQLDETLSDMTAAYFADILINRIVFRDVTNNPNQ